MGRVYLAEHEAIEKRVALKVLRSEFSVKRDIVSRFQQEAISASRIKHPNVLDVFDFGQLEISVHASARNPSSQPGPAGASARKFDHTRSGRPTAGADRADGCAAVQGRRTGVPPDPL
jgi:hypothetical protein